jgi:hypothetical protein
MLHAEHDAAHQRGHRCVKTRNLQALDAAGLRRTAGIVEQAVELAEFLHAKRDQRLHLVFDRHVGLTEHANRSEFCRQRLALGRTAAGDDDLGALRDKNFRRPQADSTRRAGDDRDLAVQPSHETPPRAMADVASAIDALLMTLPGASPTISGCHHNGPVFLRTA